MRSIVSIFALFLVSSVAFAQSKLNPVSWSFSAKKIANKTYEVHFTATLSNHYHMYAQKIDADGPVPTSFSFAKNPLLSLQGPVKEIGKKITVLEKVWNAKVSYYDDKVDFVQVVKSKVAAPTSLKGSVEYMVCDDKQCLPPKTVEFDIKLGN